MDLLINKTKHKLEGGRVPSLIKQIAKEKVNQLESVPFSNIDDDVNAILDNSDSLNLREKLGTKLSLLGKAALCILPFGNSYILDVLEVSTFTRIGKTEFMIEGTTQATFQYDGTNYPVYTKFTLEGGNNVISRYIKPTSSAEPVVVAEDIRVECPTLMAKLFTNNIDMESDVNHFGIGKDLLRLDYFDTELRAE